jgi:hypothetical protein
MGSPMTPFFVPQTTSVIKSVQSGTISLGLSANSTTLTLLSEVVLAKSFCLYNGLQTGDTYAYSSATTSSGADFTGIKLSSSSTLQCFRQGASVGIGITAPITYYTVVEYN